MGVAAILFSIILIFASGIYLFFKNRFQYFKKQGIPYAEPKFPFGNLQGINSKYHMADILINLYNEHKEKGSVVGFYNLADPVFMITDLEMIKIVTVKNFNSFVNRGKEQRLSLK